LKKPQNLHRAIVQVLVFIVLVPLLPILISWLWGWVEAWIFAVCNILSFVISRVIAGRKNPGLIQERARMLNHPDAAPFDKRLAPLLGLGNLLIVITAGLEARVSMPTLNLTEEALALAVLLAGYFVASYALIANPFFSGMVRLQTDRDHQVVDAGPYQWIRHPGYAGAILAYLATPFLLDSTWSLIPAAATILVLIIRTGMEDSFLYKNLSGYNDYADRTRYRLFPGIW